MAQKTFAQLPVASSVDAADLLAVSQGGVLKSATRTVATAHKLDAAAVFQAEVTIASPANGTVILLDTNYVIGTITGASPRMEAGSCTLTLQIADLDGSSAASITGLASLSVTTTVNEATASAANTMNTTGSTDRKLIAVLSSVSGVGPLHIGFLYTRAT